MTNPNPDHPRGLSQELIRDYGSSNVDDVLLSMLDRTYRPWRYPDPNPMPRFVLLTIPGRVRSWTAARLHGQARPAPLPAAAPARHRRDRPSPGSEAGNPPRSAPSGRRAPRYHHLRDLS